MRGFMSTKGNPHYDRAARIILKDYVKVGWQYKSSSNYYSPDFVYARESIYLTLYNWWTINLIQKEYLFNTCVLADITS